MIVISWNIRGLNSKGKQRYLKERLKKDKPGVIIFQETKISMQQMEGIIKNCKIQYEVMGQDENGSAGGLAILWNPDEVVFENWISLPRILAGMGRLIGTIERILISGVYGPHVPGERERFLRNMQVARRIYPELPWIVGGDFNMIKTMEEKKGGIRRPDQNMELFNEMITDQRLVDIPTINGVYTWNNRRGGKNQIASRLDRFLVS